MVQAQGERVQAARAARAASKASVAVWHTEAACAVLRSECSSE